MRNMIKLSALLGAVMTLGLTTASHAAPRTEASLCSVMKSAVKANGTLIRRHRQRDTLFVNHSGFCDHGEVMRWRIVRARDGRCSLKACVPYITPNSL